VLLTYALMMLMVMIIGFLFHYFSLIQFVQTSVNGLRHTVPTL